MHVPVRCPNGTDARSFATPCLVDAEILLRSLTQVLGLLNKHHQRATYGAVAGVLGKAPRSIMQGLPRDWRHSWVVNRETGLPGEYPSGKIHPAIQERAEILESDEELEAWLKEPS
jgi:hypothetical protein